MIIDCISDLHGNFPILDGGDLLIIAGDICANDSLDEWLQFFCWIQNQKYRKIVFIAGNHDNWMEKNQKEWFCKTDEIDIQYLCDSGTEFEGLKIWGCPWTAQFPGINPKCTAFAVPFGVDTDDILMKYWDLIPNDTDILITHSPPYGIFDRTDAGECVGSGTLLSSMLRLKPRLHVFGHIHECGGMEYDHSFSDGSIWTVNASIVNEYYEPVNKPVRITLNNRKKNAN